MSHCALHVACSAYLLGVASRVRSTMLLRYASFVEHRVCIRLPVSVVLAALPVLHLLPAICHLRPLVQRITYDKYTEVTKK